MASPRPATGIRIALLDDDRALATVLERRLPALGWVRVGPVDVTREGPPSPDALAALHLHALVLHPPLAGPGYLEWVAQALPGLALLVVSDPVGVADRVRGLRAGADDWITRPCHPDELIARLEAVLRRRQSGAPEAVEPAIDAGELTIRPDRFDAYAGERPAALTRREYELLRALATAGRLLTREEIYQAVWGYTMARGDRSVDVFVRKLRHKLQEISPGWRYVHTHVGVGYRFAAEPLAPAAASPHRPARTLMA